MAGGRWTFRYGAEWIGCPGVSLAGRLLGRPVVVTCCPDPDPTFPWHLLAWDAAEPCDWVDHSRGDLARLGPDGDGEVVAILAVIVLVPGALWGSGRVREGYV